MFGVSLVRVLPARTSAARRAYDSWIAAATTTSTPAATATAAAAIPSVDAEQLYDVLDR
jgi:hypothetical protein